MTRWMGLLGGLCLAGFMGLAVPAVAQQDLLNSIISSDDIGTGHSVAPSAADKERWVTSEDPLSALRVITVRPLPGESCQNVLFELRPSTRVRHDAAAGEVMSLEMSDLCLLGHLPL